MGRATDECKWITGRRGLIASTIILFTILLAPISARAEQGVFRASAENTAKIESWLQYVTSVTTGTGKKTVFVFAGIECPRCIRFSEMVSGLPKEALKEFEFRWVLYPGRNMGLFYPLVSQDGGAALMEVYREQKPKAVVDEESIMLGTSYNSLISGRINMLFPVEASREIRYTPVFVYKTDKGFVIRSLESLKEKPLESVFADATQVIKKELIPTFKAFLETATEAKGQRLLTTQTANLRMLPDDNAPALETIDEGYAVSYVLETKDWIAVSLQDTAPFAFIKKSEGKMQ